MNRKIKECICDSTEKIEKINGLPICLAWFLQNMAGILVLDADMRMKMDYPTSYMGNDKIGGGKGKKNPKAIDYIKVLHGYDVLRNTAQFAQLQTFLEWFMEQDEPQPNWEDENEEGIMWYDHAFLVEKWNECAKRKGAK